MVGIKDSSSNDFLYNHGSDQNGVDDDDIDYVNGVDEEQVLIFKDNKNINNDYSGESSSNQSSISSYPDLEKQNRGIIYGWSPLQEELVKQNTFKSICDARGKPAPCDSQLLRLNLIYVIGVFTSTGSAFFTGVFFDRMGPKWTNLGAAILLILGCLMWFIAYLFYENLYILSFAIIGIGAPASQICLLHISNLFPTQSYNIPIAYIFLGYIGLLVILFIPSFILLEHRPFLPLNEFKESEEKGLLSNVAEPFHENSHNSPILLAHTIPTYQFKQQKLSKQIFSWQFILACIFLSINFLHKAFYIGIVNQEYDQLYVDAFNYMWNGGLVFVPFVGILIVKTTLAQSGLFVNVIGIVFGVLASIPVLKLQFVTFFFISLLNVYLWTFFYVYLSDIFNYNHFGFLIGTSSIFVALVGLTEFI
eukprot:gene5000-6226_t